MTVDKLNGFKAPYRSQTFQNQADTLTGANGLMTMDGDVYTDSGNVYIPAFQFVQNGLLVIVDDPRIVPEPDHPAPYFLAVTAVTTAQTDDLQFSFPRSPTDLSPNQAIIGYYDGIEWRKPQMLSIFEVNEDVNQANIDFERFGPVSGMLSRVSGPNYETDPGVIVDRQGLRQRLEGMFYTPIIANDGDFNRVDRIVYRRADDNPARIGYRQFVLGGAHAVVPTGVHDTESFDNTKVNILPKVLIGSDNAAHLLQSYGYGVLFGIQYAKYDAARTTELIAPVDLVSSIDNSTYDAAIDKNNNIHVFYTNDGDVFWKKFDSSGTLVTGPHAIYSSATQDASKPRVAYNAAEDSFFVVFQVKVTPSDTKIFLNKFLNANGAPPISVPSFQLSLLPGVLANPDVTVTDDLDVYVIAEEPSTGKVFYRKYDYLGVAISTTLVISSNTERIGVGTLVDLAKNPRIFVSDNKTVFATFLQRKAVGIFGLTIWSEGYAFMQEIVSPTENFSSYDVTVDGFLNGIHLTLKEAAAAHYVKIEGTEVQFSYEIDPVVVGGISTARDRLGAMLHAWSKPATGSFSTYTTQTIDHLGEPPGSTPPGGVVLLNNEFLIQQALVNPKIGDRVVISSGSNAGSRLIVTKSSIDIGGTLYWRCGVDPIFVTGENGVSAAFQAPDGNAARFVKTNSELTTLAYRFNTLRTDLLLARLSQPGPVVLNYGESAVGPQPAATDKLILFGDSSVLDWEQTLAGNVTLSGPGFRILDMINNATYELVNGSYAMLEDQALYVLLDLFNTTVTPQVTDAATLDWSQPIQVLGVVKQGNFVPHALLAANGFEELEPGESNILGEDLPGIIRGRLGILSDTQFQPYLNAFGIMWDDDYATAISKLDALVNGFNTDEGDIEFFIVTNPAGQSLFQATKFVWDGDPAKVDIEVFVNGKFLAPALDGSPTDFEYHKADTDKIQIHHTVPQKALVTIRKHRTGGGNAGFLKTYEEGVLVHGITQKLNFTGGGVDAANGGAGQTNIHIPGGPAASLRFVKSHRNGEAATIPAGAVVAFDAVGNVVLADANVVTLSDFAGITVAEITPGNYGDVYKMGDCPGVLASLGATPGKLVYLGENPGQMSLTPPSGLSDSIIILGRAEPPNATMPDGTATSLYLNPQIITGGGV